MKKKRNNRLKGIKGQISGDKIFMTTVYDYFDSQYVEKLRIATNNGKKTNFEIFEEIAAGIHNIDSFRQLENSSKRLLESYNRNPLIMIFEYFSSLFLSNDEKSELLWDIMILYTKNEGVTLSEFDRMMEKLEDAIEKRSKDALNKHISYKSMVCEKYVAESLNRITNKFMEGYNAE